MEDRVQAFCREGYENTIDWKKHPRKWDAMKKMFEAHPRPVPADQIGRDANARSSLKHNMKSEPPADPVA